MTKKQIDALVGKTEDEAKKELEEGYSIRVNKRDGKIFYGTMDYKPKRINVNVDNNVITKINGLN